MWDHEQEPEEDGEAAPVQVVGDDQVDRVPRGASARRTGGCSDIDAPSETGPTPAFRRR